MFESYKKEVLPEKIVDDVLNQIKERKLSPGDRLPSERVLAEQSEVGRPTVRAAMRALASMNIIEIRPGSGAYVRSLEPETMLERIEFIFFLEPTSITHYYQTRRALELEAIELATSSITDQEIAQLEVCLSKMVEADNQRHHDNAFLFDSQFHTLIAEASRNPLLSRLIRLINELGRGYRQQIMAMREEVTTPAEDHHKILDAIRSRNPLLAREAMVAHLAHSEAGHLALVGD